MTSSDSKPVVGVIGLGRMGAAIAARLRSEGVTVTATDRRPEAAGLTQTIGATWVDDAATVTASSTVVLTLLPGPNEVREVMQPVLDGLHPSAAWIDMTSGVPALTAEIRERAGQRARLLECPVGGDPSDAREGRLLGYLGADEADRVRYRWLIDLLCREVVHVGPPGTGYVMKLVSNLLWFGQAIAVSEALALAARLGLDPHEARTSLGRGPAGSRFVDRDAVRLLHGDDMATFSLARCLEELEGIVALGEGHGLDLSLAAGVRGVYRRALDRYGDVDGELLAARLVAEDLGVEFGGPGTVEPAAGPE